MVFSKAPEKDLPGIINAQIEMALETEDFSLDRGTVTKGVRHLHNNPTSGNYWVCKKDNELLGCLLTLFEWSDWRNGNVIWIHSVYVPKEHRQKGVFKFMYSELKALIEKDDSLKGLRLYVDKSNTNAQSVYTKLGMNGDHYKLFEWMK